MAEIAARVIERKGASELVEWLDADGRYQRAYVPKGTVTSGMADSDILDMGIPYGVDWATALPSLEPPSPQAVANELRRHGIWTLADARNNGALAVSALMRVFNVGLGLLVEAAENDKENVR